VVLLTGAIVTERSICEVECELPPEVESAEQGIAWVAWCLDNAAGGRFEPAAAPAWLAEGRQHLHLLPWERESAAYAARPHCVVQRDWARVALKALGEQLTTVDDEVPVTFGFDGNVLTISCAGKISPMPAEGSPWTQPYSIGAGALRSLPKRLMSYSIQFSVWDAVLTIGNRCYRPVFATDVGEGTVVARANRQMPDLEKHVRSGAGQSKEVASATPRVAPHWAIADLLDEGADLDALAQEAVEQGLTSKLYTDHDPLLFLDRNHPELPPWLPEDYGRPLSPEERLAWFDELLRRDYGPSATWPPTDDTNTRRREVTMCLYRMYLDRITGILPEPSFVRGEQRSQSSNKGAKKP
jgi:hypothetical protein